MRRNEQTDELLGDIRSLRHEIAELLGQRDSLREDIAAGRKIEDLQKEITKLGIDKDRIVEKNDRERREVEHMVGLEKNRQKVELAQAEREARLVVREENLAADKDRFDKHVEFIEARFSKEVDYLKSIMVEIMGRLPKVDTLIKVGGNGNGGE